MKTKQILIIVALLLAGSCAAPYRIKSPDRLFYDITYKFPLSDYTLILKTKDTTFYIANASVTDSGDIIGQCIPKRKTDLKKMVFYGEYPIVRLHRKSNDSLSNEIKTLQFSKYGINKVLVYDSFKGSDKRILYEQDYNYHNIVRGAEIFTLIILVVTVYFKG